MSLAGNPDGNDVFCAWWHSRKVQQDLNRNGIADNSAAGVLSACFLSLAPENGDYLAPPKLAVIVLLILCSEAAFMKWCGLLNCLCVQTLGL